MGPFCLLANNLLRALGFSDYTRRLFPISSCGKSHAIPLNAAGVFEVLCASGPGHFDVRTDGKMVTGAAQARKNETAILGAFFDLEVVRDICRQHHLLFENR